MNLSGVKATSVWLDDFGFEPATRRISTLTRESNIFGETLHYANPIMYSFAELEEMAEWCYKTFGATGYNPCTMQTVWGYQYDPDYIFWFGEEKHLVMFILRWS
jgi:hypothetical protein